MARSESKSISDSFGESMERAGYTLIIEVLALNNLQQTKENHSKENHSNDRRRRQFLNLYSVRPNDSLNCNQDRIGNLFLISHRL